MTTLKDYPHTKKLLKQSIIGAAFLICAGWWAGLPFLVALPCAIGFMFTVPQPPETLKEMETYRRKKNGDR